MFDCRSEAVAFNRPRRHQILCLASQKSIALGALLAVSICLSGCSNDTQSPDNPAKPVAITVAVTPKVEHIQIKTEPIEKRTLGKNMHITGHIHALHDKETDVSPRFSGRVVELNVKQGDEVVPGQILAVIDSHEISSLQAELIEAKSKLRIAEAHEEREKQIYQENLQRPKALNEAKTRFEHSKVHLQLAETEFKRIEGLHKEKIAAEKDFVAAQAALNKAKLDEKEAQTEYQHEESLYNNRSLLRKDLQLAEAETLRDLQHLNTLKQRLELAGLTEQALKKIMESSKLESTLPIKSRVSGVITHIEHNVGEMVTPEKRMFTITDLSQVAVVADLPEIDLGGIKLGHSVMVKVPSYPDESFTATANYISDVVNPETRTVAVRAALDNKSRKFKLNMSADIYLSLPPRAVIACPRSAVRYHKNHAFVVVKERNDFLERPVELGADNDSYYEVVHGLREGDEVVTEGSLVLTGRTDSEHH